MIFTSVILAVREIRRHLLRTFLTTLGIVIGVASVITMLALGNGATKSITDQISSLGSGILQIQASQNQRPGGTATSTAPPPFKAVDIEAIREQIGGVIAATGQAQSTGIAIRNAQNWSTTINGTTDDYFIAQKWAVSAGRVFTAGEESAGRSVCVIGATIVKNLFQGIDPIGQTFRIKGIACDVAAEVERKCSGAGGK